MGGTLRGGTYSIDGVRFPAPVAEWDENVTSPGIDGIPRHTTYRIHRWNFGNLPTEDYRKLAWLYNKQQQTKTQLGILETEPYPVYDDPDDPYVTRTYNDFVILSIAPRIKGLGEAHDSVAVVFEVYVPLSSDHNWSGS